MPALGIYIMKEVLKFIKSPYTKLSLVMVMALWLLETVAFTTFLSGSGTSSATTASLFLVLLLLLQVAGFVTALYGRTVDKVTGTLLMLYFGYILFSTTVTLLTGISAATGTATASEDTGYGIPSLTLPTIYITIPEWMVPSSQSQDAEETGLPPNKESQSPST